MSSYYVYSSIYGHKNVKKSLIFVFSADDSKNLVTFWVKLT